MLQYIEKHPIYTGIGAVIVALISKVIIAIILTPFISGYTSHNIKNDILLIWLISLPIETLVGQVLPYYVLRKFGVTSPVKVVLISGAFFAASHLAYGPAYACVILGPSLVFALMWFAYRRISFIYAFIGVTVIHYLHNVISLLFN